MMPGRRLLLLLALCVLLPGSALWCAAARPVLAEGIVVNAAGTGPAGWQVDASALGPAPASGSLAQLAAAPAAAARTYVVQPGETLSAIAEKLGVDQAKLAAANGLDRPDLVKAGQRLVIDSAPAAAPAIPALPPGSPLAHVQLQPWPPVQGQTVTLWWRTAPGMSLTVSLDGAAVPAVGDGGRGWAFLPIQPLADTRTERLVLAGGTTSVTLPFPVTAGVFETGDVPPDTADPILSQAQKVQAETDRLAALFARQSPFGWTPGSRFRLPLAEDGPHTSPFGTRRVYGSSSNISVHTGEDFGVAAGTPVLAPAAGEVVLAETLFVRGNAVVLDHGHGVLTGYWHMQVLNVKVGDHVEAGQKLGEVGSTGMSTGPHLHWELHVNGVPVDPLQWTANGS